jgi:hypothetical protein
MAASDSSTASFDWHPARLLRDQDDVDDFALLVLNQPLRNGAHLRKLWKNCMWITAQGASCDPES